MISAKRQVFREEIRRRQIDQQFKARRKELLKQQKEPPREQACSCYEQVSSILHNIKAFKAAKDNYSLYEAFKDLKSITRIRNAKSADVLIKQQLQLIQEINLVLVYVHESDLDDWNKLPFFQICVDILYKLVALDKVSSSRLLESAILESLSLFFDLKIDKVIIVEKLMCLLATATRHSESIANFYSRQKIPGRMIELACRINPKPNDPCTEQFLFFIRAYLELIQSAELLKDVLDPEHVEKCIKSCVTVFEYFMNQSLNPRAYSMIEDALCVMKMLLNFELVPFDHAEIEDKAILELIVMKNVPTEVKKEAAYIIDHLIYAGDELYIESMVMELNLLEKVLCLSQQFDYIKYNIMANCAISENWRIKERISACLPRVKMALCIDHERKEIYQFVFNYLCSQQFKIHTDAEYKIIDKLWGVQTSRPEVIRLLAMIWIGLLNHGSHLRPPLWLLHNNRVKEVEDLIYVLQMCEGEEDPFQQGHYQTRIQAQ